MDGLSDISIQQTNAIHWIVTKLEKHNVSYQIVGGLAAKAYGAARSLADIDIYINYQKSTDFLTDIKKYITWGPEHQKDNHWNITYLKIEYEGQKIEIGASDNAYIFDSGTGKWIPQAIDYTSSERKMIGSRSVCVMPLEQLIKYKSALARDVDMQDTQEMIIARNRN